MINKFRFSSANSGSERGPEVDSVFCIGVEVPEVPSQVVVNSSVVIDYVDSDVPSSYSSQIFGGPEEEI